MKKLVLAIAVLIAVPALAGDKRISNELAVVKACEAAIREQSLDLATVYDASVSDMSPRPVLQVTLSHRYAEDFECARFFWFTYEGDQTTCPDASCPEGQPCTCVIGTCTGIGTED